MGTCASYPDLLGAAHFRGKRVLGGLTLGTGSYRRLFTHGVVAQLGERLNGIQEVVSSILSSSTRFLKLIQFGSAFLLHEVA